MKWAGKRVERDKGKIAVGCSPLSSSLVEGKPRERVPGFNNTGLHVGQWSVDSVGCMQSGQTAGARQGSTYACRHLQAEESRGKIVRLPDDEEKKIPVCRSAAHISLPAPAVRVVARLVNKF